MSKWQALIEHYRHIATQPLCDYFKTDPNRFEQFHLKHNGLLFDFSKQGITQTTLSHLCQLADNCQLSEKRMHLFSGETVNQSEDRAALHMAWRHMSHNPFPTSDDNVMPLVKDTLSKMSLLADHINQGHCKSASNQPFTDIIHLGIGGSSLGPMLLYDVAKRVKDPAIKLKLHFVENADSHELSDALTQCNPNTTLFVIVSKSFRTQETVQNARLAVKWLSEQLNVDAKTIIKQHCIAVSDNKQAAIEFGIAESHYFPLPDWVGGRYSVWTATSFSVCAAIGKTAFYDFLSGAEAMDQHFLNTPHLQNLPVIHGLLRIWHRHIVKQPTYGILPYAHDLRKLPSFLQQLEMESNGKSTTQTGTPISYKTAPLLWGSAESQAQHSVHQWLLQSPDFSPVDFIAIKAFADDAPTSLLYAQCLSQSHALLFGRNQHDCEQTLQQDGVEPKRAKQLASYQVLPGNRPSNTLVLSRLDPQHLGCLLSFYEHSIFVQSVIWDINPFDQWGVEQGKYLTQDFHTALNNRNIEQLPASDSSSRGLMAFYSENS